MIPRRIAPYIQKYAKQYPIIALVDLDKAAKQRWQKHSSLLNKYLFLENSSCNCDIVKCRQFLAPIQLYLLPVGDELARDLYGNMNMTGLEPRTWQHKINKEYLRNV